MSLRPDHSSKPTCVYKIKLSVQVSFGPWEKGESQMLWQRRICRQKQRWIISHPIIQESEQQFRVDLGNGEQILLRRQILETGQPICIGIGSQIEEVDGPVRVYSNSFYCLDPDLPINDPSLTPFQWDEPEEDLQKASAQKLLDFWEAMYSRQGTDLERHLYVLGLNSIPDLELLKRTFRQLSKAHHPDVGGSHEAFLKLKHAYESLIKVIWA